MTRSDTDANVGSYLQYGMFCLLRSSPDRIKKKEKTAMKLRHAAAIVPCAIALTACTAVTSTQNADLAGRSLMWADGATEECEVPPSIKFGADGKVSGNAGCNLLVGGWTLQGDKLDLSQLGSTRRMCGPELMKMEDAFLSNLGKTEGEAREAIILSA